MKKVLPLLALTGLLARLDATLCQAAKPGPSTATLHVIDIKAQHPKAYHPGVGDAAQCYLRFPVVPGKMVDDLKFKIKGTSVIPVGVVHTSKRPGGGEISAFFYAISPGMSYVTFDPIPGHTSKAVRIAFLVAGKVEKGGKRTRNIIDTATAAGSFTMLLGLLEKADFAWVLELDGPFTLLAPTDEAFRKLSKTQLRELTKPENKPILRRVLAYHVLSGARSAKQLFAMRSFGTWGGQVQTHLPNETLSVPGGPEAAVVKRDVDCSNGVMHAIDGVLLPPKSAK